MKLLTCLIENFGDAEIGHIAAQIAATCRKTAINVWLLFNDGLPELYGSTAKNIGIHSGTLTIEGENISVKDYIIYIDKLWEE